MVNLNLYLVAIRHWRNRKRRLNIMFSWLLGLLQYDFIKLYVYTLVKKLTEIKIFPISYWQVLSLNRLAVVPNILRDASDSF